MSSIVVICYYCKKEVKEMDCVYDCELNDYVCFECLERNTKKREGIAKFL